MNFLKFTEELDQALSIVIHAALQAKGLEAFAAVNTVVQSINAKLPASVLPVAEADEPICIVNHED